MYFFTLLLLSFMLNKWSDLIYKKSGCTSMNLERPFQLIKLWLLTVNVFSCALQLHFVLASGVNPVFW